MPFLDVISLSVFGMQTDMASADDMSQKCNAQNDDDEVRIIEMNDDTEEQLSTVMLTTPKETRQKPLHEEGVRIGIFTVSLVFTV